MESALTLRITDSLKKKKKNRIVKRFLISLLGGVFYLFIYLFLLSKTIRCIHHFWEMTVAFQFEASKATLAVSAYIDKPASSA